MFVNSVGPLRKLVFLADEQTERHFHAISLVTIMSEAYDIILRR